MTPDELKRKRKVLHDLVDNYTQDFPPLYSGPQSDRSNDVKGAVILISGCTGAFGANLLGIFAQSPHIQTIYSISRPARSGPDVVERHARGLVREGYSTNLLNDGKVRMIEGELHLEEFGLEHELYATLVDTVTHVIVNGWNVNLSSPLSDFAPNLLSVRKAADFCLRSRVHSGQPAKPILISSVGVIRNGDAEDPRRWFLEESLPEPDSALNTGYCESKWIAEHILDKAAQCTPLKPTAARLTQCVGGPNGNWSEKDWFALMVRSSVFLGKTPITAGAFDYMRSDDAAKALLDMLDTESPYIHLCHPNPVSAIDFLELVAFRLGLQAVHIDDWMEAMLREYQAAVEAAKRKAAGNEKVQREAMRQHFRSNPASRILPIFRLQQDSCRGKPLEKDVATSWTPKLACRISLRESKTLQALKEKQLGLEDIERWFAKWREAGALPSQDSLKARL